MLYDHYRVPLGQQGVKRFKKLLHIIEMKSGGRFIENEEYSLRLSLWNGLIHREEVRKLDSLAFTSRECTAALSELDVWESDIHQRLKPFRNSLSNRIILGPKERDSLFHAQIQDIVNIHTLISHLKNIRFEAFSRARLTDHLDISHKLHADLHKAFTLTFRTASAINIEREMRWCVTVQFRILLIRQQLSYIIVYLEICHGIGPWTLTYRILVHILYLGDPVKISRKATECSRSCTCLIYVSINCRVQYISDKWRLTASADSSDNRKDSQRESYINILEVVLHRTLNGNGIIPISLLPYISLTQASKVLESQRPGIYRRIGVFTQSSLIYDLSAVHTCLRSYIYKNVCSPHDFLIMLNHHNCVPDIPQPLENWYKSLCITRMQSNTRFIKNI